MDEQSMQEMYRLTKENNKMLHSMRRSAFWGGLIRWGLYILLFIVAPLWFYNVYLQPILGKISDTNACAQSQILTVQNAWKALEAKFGIGTSTRQ